uniref:Uncharacterized protein n=1 Tax=Peronospora matthiolae TaxID=2874970 RepID=A0AAV1UDP6_9STRA
MADGDLWRDRNKVFVAGLPPHIDDNALYEKFHAFGEMHQSKVVYDPKTGRSKGFGFVTFCDYTNALDAVDQVNQTKWDKRVLNVRFLQPKTENGSTATTGREKKGSTTLAVIRPKKVIGPRPEGCTTIYVGNLAYDITEEVLRKVFDKCGGIRAVRFAEHIQTKEFRGFGYVQFHEEGPCEAAIKLDGMIVMGRPMNIDYGARDDGFAQAREELQKKLKKGICHKFQQGQCTRGDACKFAHVMQDQDAEELVQPAERPAGELATPGAALAGPADPNARMVDGEKTQATSDAPICINFQKGKCKRGAACKFRHLHGSDSAEKTAMEENGVEIVQAESEGKEEVPEEEKTLAEEAAPVCQNYQKGKCKRGAACRFRHVTAPAGGDQVPKDKSWKAPIRVVLPVAAVAEVAVCRNFQSGMCARGASCRFAHTDYEPQAAPLVAVEEVSEYQKRFQSVCYNWQRSGSCARGNNCPFQHDQGIATMQSKQAGEAETQFRTKGDKDKESSICEAEDATDEEEVDGKRSKKHEKSKKVKRRRADEEGEDEPTKHSKAHKKDKKRKAGNDDGHAHDVKMKHKKDKKHKKSKKADRSD